MRLTLSDGEYDLSFSRRTVTFATLRRKGEVVGKAGSILHPGDSDSPVLGREEALKNLVEGKGTMKTWGREIGTYARLQHLRVETARRVRKAEEVRRVVSRINKIPDSKTRNTILGPFREAGGAGGEKRYRDTGERTKTQPAPRKGPSRRSYDPDWESLRSYRPPC